jgi:hypothetical protein
MQMVKKQIKESIEFTDYQYFPFSMVIVLLPLFLLIQFLLLPDVPFRFFELIKQNNSLIYNYLNVYPVIVEHNTYIKPKKDQIPVYSSITSGGSGGITKEKGFHTLSNSDELLITYSSSEVMLSDSEKKTNQMELDSKKKIQNTENKDSLFPSLKEGQNKNNSIKNLNKEKLPTKIPANYRFKNDFALRWDNSPTFAIASVELKGYKYFRDMLRQIRENFAPPGLNLVWRDSAGMIISQPIKPQIVQVLFLLDYDGTVRDVKIVSSMGQKPVDEACIRALLNQNFGTPPPEIFENGNIFGINFIFPPVY